MQLKDKELKWRALMGRGNPPKALPFQASCALQHPRIYAPSTLRTTHNTLQNCRWMEYAPPFVYPPIGSTLLHAPTTPLTTPLWRILWKLSGNRREHFREIRGKWHHHLTDTSLVWQELADKAFNGIIEDYFDKKIIHWGLLRQKGRARASRCPQVQRGVRSPVGKKSVQSELFHPTT